MRNVNYLIFIKPFYIKYLLVIMMILKIMDLVVNDYRYFSFYFNFLNYYIIK